MQRDKPIVFSGILIQHLDMDAAYVEFPFSAEEISGKKGQIKVMVWFDHRVEYRGSLTKMGSGSHCLGVTKAIRKQLGKTFGDTVEVKLMQDLEERTVEIPEDVQLLLDENDEAAFLFKKMSYTHRKEYISWITEAKKPETRERRRKKMIEMIVTGKKGV